MNTAAIDVRSYSLKERSFAVFAILIFVVLSLFALDYLKRHFADSAQAQRIKATLNPISKKLETAQKTGDKDATLSLLQTTTNIINEFNNLDEASKNTINSSPIHYCFVAALNLSEGISQVYETGHWLNKEQYQNAISACK